MNFRVSTELPRILYTYILICKNSLIWLQIILCADTVEEKKNFLLNLKLFPILFGHCNTCCYGSPVCSILSQTRRKMLGLIRVNLQYTSMLRDLYINAFRARGQQTDQVIVCPTPCYNAPDSMPVRQAHQYSCNIT